MEGFRGVVDGYVDVENQLRRYLRQRAADGFAAEREAKDAIGSRSEFEARRERVRDEFLSGIGRLPDRPDDPAVETTGVLDRDGYTIELLTWNRRSRTLPCQSSGSGAGGM